MSDIDKVLKKLRSDKEVADDDIKRLVLSRREDIVPFIEKVIEEEGIVQEGEMKKTRRSALWNKIAMTYFFQNKHENSERILRKVLDMELDNPGTLNNFSLVLLQTGRIKEAKKFILRAYDLDVKHRKFKAALLPAYRNLSWILINEAENYNAKDDYLPAFLLSWISIELSLRRLWFELIEKYRYNGKRLSRWNVSYIIEILSLLGIITSLKNDIETARGRRKSIVHATGETPTEGETNKCIQTATKLAGMSLFE